MTSTRPPLHLLIGGATHFLAWERAHYATHFSLMDEPGPRTHLHVFGPDVLAEGLATPASRRSAYLFPGFVNPSPWWDAAVRAEMEATLADYDLVFVNPGPMAALFGHLPQTRVVPFSVDADKVPFRTRTSVRSLLHAAANYAHKDSPRSIAVMEATGLDFEVFPPRDDTIKSHWSTSRRAKLAANKLARLSHVPLRFDIGSLRYVTHEATIGRYLAHDGFVHVAAPVPPGLDGLYTATLIEAGLSGAIVFWHDTHGLGGFLDTVVETPVEPEAAAGVILDAIGSLDLAEHSRATQTELRAHFSPAPAVGRRAAAILEL
jgi:hypothetical protein